MIVGRCRLEYPRGDAVFDATPETAQAVLTDAVARSSVTRFGRLRPTLGEIFREITSEAAHAEQTSAQSIEETVR